VRLRAIWFSWAMLLPWRGGKGLSSRPAEVRRYLEVRVPLTLAHPYYPARRGDGIELIPKDRYFESVEQLLDGLESFA